MSVAAPQSERRQRQRQRSLLGGRICYGPRFTISITCVIRNVHPGGAMLLVPKTQPVPAQFVLLNIMAGVAHPAQLSWRNGEFIGCTLGGAIDLHGEVPRELVPLRFIWMALAPR